MAQRLFEIEQAGLGALAPTWSLAAYLSELESPESQAFFLTEPNLVGPDKFKISGFVLYRDSGAEAWIMNLAVEQKKHGLGKKLMHNFLEHLTKSSDCEWVGLEVRAKNLAARALYAHFDFAPLAQRRAYYADGDDALVLQKQLNRSR